MRFIGVIFVKGSGRLSGPAMRSSIVIIISGVLFAAGQSVKSSSHSSCLFAWLMRPRRASNSGLGGTSPSARRGFERSFIGGVGQGNCAQLQFVVCLPGGGLYQIFHAINVCFCCCMFLCVCLASRKASKHVPHSFFPNH